MLFIILRYIPIWLMASPGERGSFWANHGLPWNVGLLPSPSPWIGSPNASHASTVFSPESTWPMLPPSQHHSSCVLLEQGSPPCTTWQYSSGECPTFCWWLQISCPDCSDEPHGFFIIWCMSDKDHDVFLELTGAFFFWSFRLIAQRLMMATPSLPIRFSPESRKHQPPHHRNVLHKTKLTFFPKERLCLWYLFECGCDLMIELGYWGRAVFLLLGLKITEEVVIKIVESLKVAIDL